MKRDSYRALSGLKGFENLDITPFHFIFFDSQWNNSQATRLYVADWIAKEEILDFYAVNQNNSKWE